MISFFYKREIDKAIVELYGMLLVPRGRDEDGTIGEDLEVMHALSKHPAVQRVLQKALDSRPSV